MWDQAMIDFPLEQIDEVLLEIDREQSSVARQDLEQSARRTSRARTQLDDRVRPGLQGNIGNASRQEARAGDDRSDGGGMTKKAAKEGPRLVSGAAIRGLHIGSLHHVTPPPQVNQQGSGIHLQAPAVLNERASAVPTEVERPR